ncbi:HEVEIN-LIKE, pathogenesis-related 4 [Hibiscus trionum]|uniref:HEVEIN-LIKE, pathogenesis-related 4 n=1 Tax=Hibiscus trionum TaxID=183268 RepID=A0A9W7GUC8_HIBTR|nr:HEVEIN-LIKE, pathogenesis-related 4 [Hibiscus trionum]
MERSVMSVSLLVLACLVSSAAAQSAENVKAYMVYLYAEENDWDMNAAHVYCATWDADKPYEWRSKYNWTNFGGPNGPIGKDACGKCVQVTNTATGDETIVRIVGTSQASLNLDKPVFDQLDSDGQGQVAGHLVVNYTFVDCDPKPPGPGESNVTAYYSDDYNPIGNDWTYPPHAFCTALDGGKPLEWRNKYGWTGYCGNYSSSNPEDICGKCLKVTNTDTKDSEIVRIMDTCGSEALVLDKKTGFDPIDSNGEGNAAGHLVVDYEFVDCEDEVDSPLLVYSQ